MMKKAGLYFVCLSTVGCIKANLTSRTQNGQEESSSSSVSSSSSSVASAAIPAGAVIPFDGPACPSGWIAFDAAKGRVIFGDGSGNTDADGTALTARVLGTSGGLEYTTGIPASTLDGTGTVLGAAYTFGAGIGARYVAAAPDVWANGAQADSNLPPYVARLFCKNAADVATVPASATVAHESATCPLTGWAADTSVEGRVVVGVGSGNNDAQGASLTIRAMNDIGGREYTTGFPVSSTAANVLGPGPTVVLGVTASKPYIQEYNGYPQNVLSGARADGNMPPFVALKSCKRDSNPVTEMAAGSVVAFDLASCPTGWSTYSAAQGRTLVGVGSSNVDAAGTALTARALSDVGGREHTTGLVVHWEPGEVEDPTDAAPNPNFARPTNAGNGYTVMATPDTTLFGPKANSNMPPYYVLHYCKKD